MTQRKESIIKSKERETFPFKQGDRMTIDGRELEVVKVRNTGTQKYVNFYYLSTDGIMEKMGYNSFLHAVGIS